MRLINFLKLNCVIWYCVQNILIKLHSINCFVQKLFCMQYAIAINFINKILHNKYLIVRPRVNEFIYHMYNNAGDYTFFFKNLTYDRYENLTNDRYEKKTKINNYYITRNIFFNYII